MLPATSHKALYTSRIIMALYNHVQAEVGASSSHETPVKIGQQQMVVFENPAPLRFSSPKKNLPDYFT